MRLQLCLFGRLTLTARLVCRLTNRTDTAHQMFLFTRERRATVDFQGYALDGPKTMHFKILPRATWVTTYLLVPLVAGELALPSFVIKCKRDVSTTVEGSDCARVIQVCL